ncbi:MAG: methylmalonyl-CoA mutase family protein [Saprospiraceae bacterium]|jgi:methylmalonyl-CoA mutase|nr:methylmalonyl-CoA mutase family protein [Saprospiraceae bacterium]
MKKLFSEFNGVDKKEWLKKVEQDLKGKPLNGLNSELFDLEFSPFYHLDDLEQLPYTLNSGQSSNDWEIAERIHVVDYKIANYKAIKSLEYGAQALQFIFSKCPTKIELKTLLTKINLEFISVHFFMEQENGEELISNFIDFCQTNNINLQKIYGSFNVKTIQKSTLFDSQWINSHLKSLPNFALLTINCNKYYNGKQHVISELAQILKEGNDLLIALKEQKLKTLNIRFSIVIGEDFFINIAKLRAFKMLWIQILETWELTYPIYTKIEVHLAENSQTENANSNMIKATSQAMSAVLGGTHTLFLLPSDNSTQKDGTDFSRRIARNIQHLLKMENYLNRVIDPSAGSYFIENLTQNMAEQAWSAFQKT